MASDLDFVGDETHFDPSFNAILAEEFGLSSPANIIVTGLTGAGKSTLINGVFGAQFCSAGIGAPVTQGVQRIVQPDKPLVLYDTKGLEVENSKTILESLYALLRELRGSNDATKQPHAMWLCINTGAARFEDIHERLIKIAQELAIPLIIVLTQDYFGDSEDLAVTIGSIVGPTVPIAPVVAAEYTLGNDRKCRTRGLGQLITLTAEFLPAGARAAFEYAQVADLERKRVKALEITNRTAKLAFATAFPASFAPMSHSVVLVALETHMLHAINKVLGLELPRTKTRALTLGLAGIVAASFGGKAIATQLASLIPGIGQITAATVGGSVAAGIVKALGTAYSSAVIDYVSRGDLDPAVEQLIDMVREYLPSTIEMLRSGHSD